MAKTTAKRSAKKAPSTRPKSISSLLGKPGLAVKIVSLSKDCTTGESSGRFTMEGTYKKPKKSK